MNKILITLFMTFILTGCNISRPEFTHSTYHDVEVLYLNPPKHVYVDLKVLSDGSVYDHVYVSKHCNSWRKNAPIGRVFKARLDHYITRYEDGFVKRSWGWNTESLRSELCK